MTRILLIAVLAFTLGLGAMYGGLMEREAALTLLLSCKKRVGDLL